MSQGKAVDKSGGGAKAAKPMGDPPTRRQPQAGDSAPTQGHAAGSGVARGADTGAGEPAWLLPISTAEPCGPNLEYEAEYSVLLARLAPQAEAQYGKFVDRPEPPDWAEVERDCRRLLLRSKDISVFVWLARCRTRLAGAAGLQEVLAMLAQTLRRYPEHVHPQRVIEGEDDPAVRANALAALADPEGLLADIREIVLSPNTAFRLTVKDVERAHAIPRTAEALTAEAVAQQLSDMRSQGHAQVLALAGAVEWVREIDQWSQQNLQEEAPELGRLVKLLALFAAPVSKPGGAAAVASTVPSAASDSEHAQTVAQPPAPQDAAVFQAADAGLAAPNAGAMEPSADAPNAATLGSPGPWSPGISLTASVAEQREQVRFHIRLAKEWLDHNEPSSPVALLLKQAERLLGKRFAEVAQAIPAELLARWDQED